MTNPAVITDVEAHWHPLSPQQAINADAFLEDAWALLKSKIANLDARSAADPDLAANVVRVEVQMVLRVLKNPEGTKSTTLSIDDASRTWTRNDAASSGLMYVSDDELEQLSPGGGYSAFTIRPAAHPFYSPNPFDVSWGSVEYGAGWVAP